MKITQHVGKYFGTGDRLLKSRFSNWTMIALLAFYGCGVGNKSIPSSQSAASQTHETSQQALFFADSATFANPTSAETPAEIPKLIFEIDGLELEVRQGPPLDADGKPLPVPDGWTFKIQKELTPEQRKILTAIYRAVNQPGHYLYGSKPVAVRIPHAPTIDAEGITLHSGAKVAQMMFEVGETTLYQRGSIWERIGGFFGSPNQSGDDNKTYKANNCWLDKWGSLKAAFETFVKVPKNSGLIVGASFYGDVSDGVETLKSSGNLVQAELFSSVPSGPAYDKEGKPVPGYKLNEAFGGKYGLAALEAAGVTITTNELPQNARGLNAPPRQYDPSVRDFSQKAPTGESSTRVPQSSSAPSDASPVVPRVPAGPADASPVVRTPRQTSGPQPGHSPSTLVAKATTVTSIFGGYTRSLLGSFGFSENTADKADVAAQIAGFGADVATAGGVAAGVGTAIVSVTTIGGGLGGSYLADLVANALGVTSENLREVIQFGGATLGASGGAGLGATIAHGLNLIAATSLGAAFAGAALPVIAMGATGTVAHAGGKAVSENFIVPFIPSGDAHSKAYNKKGFAAGTPPTKCSCLTQDCTPSFWGGNGCVQGKTTEMIVPDQASCNQQNGKKFESTIGGVTSYTVRLRCSTNSPSPSGPPASMGSSGDRN